MRSEEEQKYETILEDVRETSWRRQYLKDYLNLMSVSNMKKSVRELSRQRSTIVKAHKQEGKHIVGELQVSPLS